MKGPSGSGKSTLLHLIAGLETPSSGDVRFRGRDLGSMRGKERTRFRLRNVGIVFQQFHLLPTLSARANVAMPLLELGVSKGRRREVATRLLERVGLKDRVFHRPGELSGGEQQRVAVARALITDPDLLLADEPTGEIDTETGRKVLELFTEFSEGRCILIASHDEEAISIADRVVELRDGRVQ